MESGWEARPGRPAETRSWGPEMALRPRGWEALLPSTKQGAMIFA